MVYSSDELGGCMTVWMSKRISRQFVYNSLFTLSWDTQLDWTWVSLFSHIYKNTCGLIVFLFLAGIVLQIILHIVHR